MVRAKRILIGILCFLFVLFSWDWILKKYIVPQSESPEKEIIEAVCKDSSYFKIGKMQAAEIKYDWPKSATKDSVRFNISVLGSKTAVHFKGIAVRSNEQWKIIKIQTDGLR